MSLYSPCGEMHSLPACERVRLQTENADIKCACHTLRQKYAFNINKWNIITDISLLIILVIIKLRLRSMMLAPLMACESTAAKREKGQRIEGRYLHYWNGTCMKIRVIVRNRVCLFESYAIILFCREKVAFDEKRKHETNEIMNDWKKYVQSIDEKWKKNACNQFK